MNPWLNYHHLLYFQTIATEGSIAKAARKLRLGQPTLSTQLKQFEQALGRELFERRQQRLHLTEAGVIALNYANEIFALGSELLDTIHDRKSIDRIAIQIGAVDAVPKEFILAVIQAARRFTDCTISIVEGLDKDLLGDLKAHQLDLVLSHHPPPVGSKRGYVARCAAQLPVVICGRAEQASLKKQFPESLEGKAMIMPDSSSKLRHDVTQFLKAHKVSVDMALEVQDASLMRLLLHQGLGVAPVTESSVRDLLQSKELVVLGTLPGVTEELWLISGERKLDNPVAAHLMKEFKIQS